MAAIKVRISALDLMDVRPSELLPGVIMQKLREAGIPVKTSGGPILPVFEGVERGVLFTQGSVEPTTELIYFWTDEEPEQCPISR